MKVVKSVNEELVYEEIDPKNYKQFKKAGWTEVKEPVKAEPILEQIIEPELTEVKQTVKNAGGRPKKTTNL
jgi:hypothetical protein